MPLAGAWTIFFSSSRLLAMQNAHYYIHINTANYLGSFYFRECGDGLLNQVDIFHLRSLGFVTVWAQSAPDIPSPSLTHLVSLSIPSLFILPAPLNHKTRNTSAISHCFPSHSPVSLGPWDAPPSSVSAHLGFQKPHSLQQQQQQQQEQKPAESYPSCLSKTLSNSWGAW